MWAVAPVKQMGPITKAHKVLWKTTRIIVNVPDSPGDPADKSDAQGDRSANATNARSHAGETARNQLSNTGKHLSKDWGWGSTETRKFTARR